MIRYPMPINLQGGSNSSGQRGQFYRNKHSKSEILFRRVSSFSRGVLKCLDIEFFFILKCRIDNMSKVINDFRL